MAVLRFDIIYYERVSMMSFDRLPMGFVMLLSNEYGISKVRRINEQGATDEDLIACPGFRTACAGPSLCPESACNRQNRGGAG